MASHNKQPRREFEQWPLCNKCNRHHRGECGVCFNCGKPGHFAKDCRMPAKGNGNDQHKQIGAPPRVYALTQSDKGAGPSDMVSGQIYTTQTSAYALMDIDASHSFISASFVEKF